MNERDVYFITICCLISSITCFRTKLTSSFGSLDAEDDALVELVLVRVLVLLTAETISGASAEQTDFQKATERF